MRAKRITRTSAFRGGPFPSERANAISDSSWRSPDSSSLETGRRKDPRPFSSHKARLSFRSIGQTWDAGSDAPRAVLLTSPFRAVEWCRSGC